MYPSVSNYLQAVTWAHKLCELGPPSVSSIPVKLALADIKENFNSGEKPCYCFDSTQNVQLPEF